MRPPVTVAWHDEGIDSSMTRLGGVCCSTLLDSNNRDSRPQSPSSRGMDTKIGNSLASIIPVAARSCARVRQNPGRVPDGLSRNVSVLGEGLVPKLDTARAGANLLKPQAAGHQKHGMSDRSWPRC